MFEFSVARKYLIPKKRQLSVSLIGLLSVLVISLVVWLLLVFLSVMDGIEKRWLDKLTTLHAPLRINPSGDYYNSYYYLVDGKSHASDYTYKTIGEKRSSPSSDPYSPEEDSELGDDLPAPARDADGNVKDPVKGVFAILERIKEKQTGFAFQDYEMSGGLLRLELLRQGENNTSQRTRSFLSQVSYFATLSKQNPALDTLLLPVTTREHNHQEFLTTTLGAEMKGEGLFLPKSFQDGGVLVGDRGYVSYPAATLGAVQEQRIPVHVEGFYDPGIMAVGTRCILAPPTVVRAIAISQGAYTLDPTLANGIQVWFSDLGKAVEIKHEIQKALQEAGLDSYWKVSTFREYDFAKDLLEQFQSDKLLFTLIGVIILIVACCNIISLLVLLVNDKKREIGILQAMGASPRSISLIFAFCGSALGILGCLIGTGCALITLHEIDAVVHFLSFLQGHEAFNAAFYGKTLPRELSMDALLFVLITTPILSLLAGLIPALKASRLKPAEILRSE
ncbi:MAG: ABC transporter permease [Chlamydiales bacterium]